MKPRQEKSAQVIRASSVRTSRNTKQLQVTWSTSRQWPISKLSHQERWNHLRYGCQVSATGIGTVLPLSPPRSCSQTTFHHRCDSLRALAVVGVRIDWASSPSKKTATSKKITLNRHLALSKTNFDLSSVILALRASMVIILDRIINPERNKFRMLLPTVNTQSSQAIMAEIANYQRLSLSEREQILRE